MTFRAAVMLESTRTEVSPIEVTEVFQIFINHDAGEDVSWDLG